MTQRGLTLVAPALPEGTSDLLTAASLGLLGEAVRAFGPRLFELLRERGARQRRIDAGEEQHGFRTDSAAVAIRESEWRVSDIPRDLLDRRVEITGPADPKMILNALGSGAQVFMADFEDSLAPTWKNLVTGQRALAAAVRGTLAHTDAATGKRYAMPKNPAVLIARPRGLHLPERHIFVDGTHAPAALFDAVMFLFHNARELLERGSGPASLAQGAKGPYLYLPKLESAAEASWWDDVLALVEQRLHIPAGSVKVTVLIETLPAAFQMDEILHALRTRVVGLNCGRWDYIFSTIKRRRREAGFVLPDRASVTMEQHFLRSYAQLLIKTCHRRGAFAMGGMSAFIPRKDDAEQNAAALEKVRADKRREAKDGHDGTWVAHPGLVAVAREVFDAQIGVRSGPDAHNQRHVMRDDVDVSAVDLLRAPEGPRTEAGLRTNARVGVQYLASWLSGQGCVPIDHLMEDAATAEISRAQLWQWVHANDGAGADVEGAPLTEARVRAAVKDATAALTGRCVDAARELFLSLVVAPELDEFLTLPAYELLCDAEKNNV